LSHGEILKVSSYRPDTTAKQTVSTALRDTPSAGETDVILLGAELQILPELRSLHQFFTVDSPIRHLWLNFAK